MELAALLAALALLHVPGVQAPLAHPRGQPAVRMLQLIDNGDFREPLSGEGDGRAGRLPWWPSRGAALIPGELPGERWVLLRPGAAVAQPVAAFGPLSGGILVRGRVRGSGLVTLTDGPGGRASVAVSSKEDGGTRFEIGGPVFSALLGREPVPRLSLELAAADGEGASFTELELLVPLPAVSEEELRADIVARLDWIIRLWTERGLDREGPRATGFFCHAFDCVSGERLATAPGGAFPLVEHLLTAAALHDDPLWKATLEAFLADYLELGLHPLTGLPQKWDVVADRPLDDRWVEIGGDLRLLLDVHERGPTAFRERALAAARRIGETVLERGVLPDGAVAAKYRAADAAVSIDVAPLRRLDVPAQLARLGGLCDDERFTVAARNALAELEYTHHWPGTWEGIDPGFDDDLGLYGGRAVTMLAYHRGDAAFRNLVASGLAHYAPLWRDALRFGGTIAADQVRTWELFMDYARLEPSARPLLDELLPAAVRAHFKGQQYGDGAWGDVTFHGFDPKSDLSVGDLPGTPSNLVTGLAVAYGAAPPLDRADLRAMYAAVLRATDEHYRRPYGYLVTRRELSGTNRGGGELRLLHGLVAMLAHLKGG